MYAELIRRLEAERDRLDAEIEMAKDEVKQYMTAQGVRTLTAGTYKVRWTEFTTHRFNTHDFKKDNPDLYEKYTVEAKATRFTIV